MGLRKQIIINKVVRVILVTLFMSIFSLKTASSQKLDFYWDYLPIDESIFSLNSATYQGNSYYLLAPISASTHLLISHDRFGQRNTDLFTDSNIRRANSIFALSNGKFFMDLWYFANDYNYFIFSPDSGITREKKYFLSENQDTILKKEIPLLTHFWDNGKAIVISLVQDSIMSTFISDNYGESWEKSDSLIVKGISTSSGYSISSDNSKYKFVNEGIIIQPIPVKLNKFIKISNYGQSLKIIDLDNDIINYQSAFKDTLSGIIKFSDSYYRTDDGMQTFTPITMSTMGDIIRDITYAQPSENFPNGFYYAYGQGDHYVSYDDGNTWEFVLYNNTQNWYSVFFDKNDFAIGVNSSEERLMFMDNHVNSFHTLSNSPILLYPNPASSEISFKEVQSGAEYKILNSLGAEVLSGVYNGNSISVSDLSSGIYLIQITKNGEIFQSRFVKE